MLHLEGKLCLEHGVKTEGGREELNSSEVRSLTQRGQSYSNFPLVFTGIFTALMSKSKTLITPAQEDTKSLLVALSSSLFLQLFDKSLLLSFSLFEDVLSVIDQVEP